MYKRVAKKKFVCFQSLLKLHSKVTYGASGFCENYTRKTPLYIYYIIIQSANAACIFRAFWYYVSVLNRVQATKKRGTERQENEPDAMRRALMLAVLPTLARRDNTGQIIHCKGDEQKNAIRFQVRYCGRGDYGGLPAIRAHKIAQAAPMRARFQKVYDYQQLLSINEEC